MWIGNEALFLISNEDTTSRSDNNSESQKQVYSSGRRTFEEPAPDPLQPLLL